ncbi:MAG: hypothetical protein Q4P18_07040 [Methanobrevibacter sp.]|uniref:hypothetical protein n=1 Tax=Methanobrevibacter sp. TaxID=66852 RepID=UPI0026DF3F3F|nr:hypothetical protein [Methanobrevibacter sp.]MDO5849272.1 hypothetical protein [Methanobrevibacter sp.]
MFLFEVVRDAFPRIELYSDEICQILQWFAVSSFQQLETFLDYYDLITADDFFIRYRDVVAEYPSEDCWKALYTPAQFIERVSDEKRIPLFYVSDELYLLRKG